MSDPPKYHDFHYALWIFPTFPQISHFRRWARWVPKRTAVAARRAVCRVAVSRVTRLVRRRCRRCARPRRRRTPPSWPWSPSCSSAGEVLRGLGDFDGWKLGAQELLMMMMMMMMMMIFLLDDCGGCLYSIDDAVIGPREVVNFWMDVDDLDVNGWGQTQRSPSNGRCQDRQGGRWQRESCKQRRRRAEPQCEICPRGAWRKWTDVRESTVESHVDIDFLRC